MTKCALLAEKNVTLEQFSFDGLILVNFIPNKASLSLDFSGFISDSGIFQMERPEIL
jgi:hypothetical protein